MGQLSGKIVGAQVTNHLIKSVLMDDAGTVTEMFDTEIDRRESIVGQIIFHLGRLKETVGAFENIGIALSGLVDRRTNRVAMSKQTPEYVTTDVAKEIEQATGIRAFLENDANAAAFGEYTFGAGKGNRNLFYILIDEGVGGAFIIEGNLWRGASGFAGEFGHLLIDSENNYRLEDLASSANILRRIRTRMHQDQTSSLAKIGEDQLTIADVVRESNNGDDFTRMMLERTGNYVGIAAAGVINLLNIEKIVVGGSIMQAGEPILEGIRHNAGEYAFQPSFETAEIVAGALGDRAVAVGAALLPSVYGNVVT